MIGKYSSYEILFTRVLWIGLDSPAFSKFANKGKGASILSPPHAIVIATQVGAKISFKMGGESCQILDSLIKN
jgi:hypothetical protein